MNLCGKGVKAKVRTILATLAVVLCASSLWCQDVPKVEVFGGYSYLRNVNSGGQGANGGAAELAYNFNSWFGIEGDIGVHHETQVFQCCSTYTTETRSSTSTLYMAGPRVALRRGPLTAFAHVVAGGVKSNVSVLGGLSSNAASAGVGVDLAVNNRVAIRIFEVDYVTNITGSPHTNNVGASAGIVFRFGGGARVRQGGATRAQTETPPVANSGQGGATSVQRPVAKTLEASLLGVAGYATEDGFKVASVREGSPAEKIFLVPGDVISKIDDRAVKSGHDIDSAIAASASGMIKVAGLTQTGLSMIPFEREVKAH
jgi:hypothetical protein